MPPDRDQSSVGTVGAAAGGVGAAFVATASAACCTGPVLAPLVVAVLGAGGAAWAAGLKPYTPYLFGASLALLGYAFHAVYRPVGADATAAGHVCPLKPPRMLRAVLWTSMLIWLGAAALAVYATYFDNPWT